MTRFESLKDFRRKRPRIYQLAAVILVIAVGILSVAVMRATREEVVKRKTTLPVPLVTVVKAETGPQRMLLTGEGTVRPLREIDVVPQVSGKVVYISPAMADGGIFSKGDVLLKIDPVDYELAVKSAEAKVKDLESKLRLTIEDAEASKEEWRLAGNSGDPPSMVAKEPQLAASRAALDAGRADLDKALLNLERTAIKAPFNGRVSMKNVDMGQFVSAGVTLGSVFSTEAAEIVIPMQDEDLFWFSAPGFTPEREEGSPATVEATIAGRALSWPGKVVRTEGILDERTRMINVVVRVDDPYGSRPPLAMGLFTSVRIEGKMLESATLLPRTALREDGTVWIVDGDSRLRFRDVETARFQGDDVVFSSGIENGDLVVTSSLKVVTDGMEVRVISPERRQGR